MHLDFEKVRNFAIKCITFSATVTTVFPFLIVFGFLSLMDFDVASLAALAPIFIAPIATMLTVVPFTWLIRHGALTGSLPFKVAGIVKGLICFQWLSVLGYALLLGADHELARETRNDDFLDFD